MVVEIGDHSPLKPALVAANSARPVQVLQENAAATVECLVRETADHWFLFACKRSGATTEVEFTGLPPELSSGEVLFEEPRKIQATAGRLKDWFAPYEVHVYRFPRR
jgi:hypothetical protein